MTRRQVLGAKPDPILHIASRFGQTVEKERLKFSVEKKLSGLIPVLRRAMSEDDLSLNVKLPDATMRALESAGQSSGRVPSEVAEDILQKHFAVREPPRKENLDRLLALAGAGATYSSFNSAEEIDA